jgi:hypothetical protein
MYLSQSIFRTIVYEAVNPLTILSILLCFTYYARGLFSAYVAFVETHMYDLLSSFYKGMGWLIYTILLATYNSNLHPLICTALQIHWCSRSIWCLVTCWHSLWLWTKFIISTTGLFVIVCIQHRLIEALI